MASWTLILSDSLAAPFLHFFPHSKEVTRSKKMCIYMRKGAIFLNQCMPSFITDITFPKFQKKKFKPKRNSLSKSPMCSIKGLLSSEYRIQNMCALSLSLPPYIYIHIHIYISVCIHIYTYKNIYTHNMYNTYITRMYVQFQDLETNFYSDLSHADL